ncbi:Regulatory protein VanR [Clostridium bornimense]|uniref:Stage 0 sporulation protein A homolog n=1 Tax=Clostridium bornimense TaxID=1216932 RepID=W6RTQ0_9CLOT|nr:response regulator transcription factor [Clostridium bornimense]CDM67668.1 Regulatory protein VanR [Clostridium bornimense]
MSKNILVVDDEKDIRDSIGIYLKSEGYNIYLAEDGMKALQILESEDIHLIIMDVMMPNLDGINATMKIRESRNIPIIMVTAKSEDVDMILGLNVGADDYIRKPFNPLELVARVKAQMRRYVTLGTYEKETKNSNEIEVRGLVLNNETKEVHVNGEEIKLTPMEFKILALLMENTGRVFPIEEIYERVWDEPFYNSENTVAVHIRRIREKIEINPKEPRYLKVVWGVGYKIDK